MGPVGLSGERGRHRDTVRGLVGLRVKRDEGVVVCRPLPVARRGRRVCAAFACERTEFLPTLAQGRVPPCLESFSRLLRSEYLKEQLAGVTVEALGDSAGSSFGPTLPGGQPTRQGSTRSNRLQRSAAAAARRESWVVDEPHTAWEPAAGENVEFEARGDRDRRSVRYKLVISGTNKSTLIDDFTTLIRWSDRSGGPLRRAADDR